MFALEAPGSSLSDYRGARLYWRLWLFLDGWCEMGGLVFLFFVSEFHPETGQLT